MSHSPHKNWKGCAMCKPQKGRGQGPRYRWRFRELRRLGQARRLRR